MEKRKNEAGTTRRLTPSYFVLTVMVYIGVAVMAITISDGRRGDFLLALAITIFFDLMRTYREDTP